MFFQKVLKCTTVVYELNVLEQFGPKILHLKIDRIYTFLLLIYNFSIRRVNFINFLCSIFWTQTVPIFPTRKLVKKTKIVNIRSFLWIVFYDKLSWNLHFIYCSNYLILDWPSFVPFPTNLFTFELAYIIQTNLILG